MQKNVNKNVEVKTQMLAEAQKNFNAIVARSKRQSAVHAVVSGVVMSVREALAYDFR